MVRLYHIGNILSNSLLFKVNYTSMTTNGYLLSDDVFLKLLDLNDSSRLSLDVFEGLKLIEEEYGSTNYGKVKFSGESLFWLGYLYRYISYTRNIDTPLLFKIFDYKRLNELFYTYHTQSMEWCVENLLVLFNLTENIFDKNWRLKEEIRKSRL